MPEVYTAPLAIIRVDGIVVGSAKNIRANETHQLGPVYGIGSYRPKELVRLRFSGSLTVGYYNLDFRNHPMGQKAITRRTGTQAQFDNNLTLQEVGLDLVFFEKIADLSLFPNTNGIDPATGLVATTERVFATIPSCFLSGDGFDLTENQISGRDSTFEFKDGIIYLP